LQSDEQLRSETGQEPDDIHGRLATYRLDELHPHPSYSRHGLAVSASQLSALAALDDQTLEEPIAITQDGLIIDGYARVERARMLGRTSMLCIEYDRTEEEALRDLLQRHLGSNRLNAFCRILLARELEPWFKKKALANQIAGGENKVSSKLTEAERVDVTAKIAEAADVSVGNISKVKQLLTTAIPELVQALRRGEISIHKAWLLSKALPANQRDELALPQCRRNIKRDMWTLASRHGSKSLPLVLDAANLIMRLSALESRKRGSFRVFVSNAQGKAICLTKELLLELGAQQESNSSC
jgi:hypothetical protein